MNVCNKVANTRLAIKKLTLFNFRSDVKVKTKVKKLKAKPQKLILPTTEVPKTRVCHTSSDTLVLLIMLMIATVFDWEKLSDKTELSAMPRGFLIEATSQQCLLSNRAMKDDG